MFIHNIFLANAFILGKRIAFDLVIKKQDMERELEHQNEIENFLLDIYNELGKDTLITTHTMITNSEKWESVVKKDSFFQDVEKINDAKLFKKYLKYNNTLTFFDIAILIRIILKRENDVLIDADALTKKIYLEYYHKYRDELYDRDTQLKENLFQQDLEKYFNVILNRIVASQNGFRKLEFINNKIASMKYS